MKKLAGLVYFILTSLLADAQQNIPAAEEVLKPVYAQAIGENKNVLVIFHASWCGWCKKMDASLQAPEVKPLIDQYYVTTHLTVYESDNKKNLENPGALQFLTKHGGDNKGLPYWLVLNKSGDVLANSEYEPGKNTGCPASETEVAYWISVLKKTSALNEKELGLIEKRFRMNEQQSALVR